MSTGKDFNNAILVTLDTLQDARVSSSQQEVYFKFNLEKGEIYRLTTLSDDDLMAFLYDSNENQIGYDDDTGEGYNPLIDFEATKTGIYYVMIRAYSASNTIDFKFSLTKFVAKDGDSFGTALPITVDSVTSWGISSELPELYFKFVGVEGERYSITTISNSDYVAYLYDSNRNQIDYNDDGGEGYNPLIGFDCRETNTYYIKINRYGGAGSTSYFQLALTTQQARDGDSFLTAIPIEFNDVTNGTFYPTVNYFYFKINLPDRKNYTLKFFNYNLDYDIGIYNSYDAYIIRETFLKNDNTMMYDFGADTSSVYVFIKYQGIIEENENPPFSFSVVDLDESYAKSMTVIPHELFLKPGDSQRLIADIRPIKAVNKSVIWASEDETIATVDQNGVVTAIKQGWARITATTNDGSVSNYSNINVNLWNGAGYYENPYLITNATDLANIWNDIENSRWKYYRQTADIDLSGIDWQPIGSFTKHFRGFYDGGNYKISNLTVKKTGIDGVGLFGRARDGELKNIHIVNGNVTSYGYVGGLLGYTGGLASENYTPCTVKNCTFDGVVSGSLYAGGLIGYSVGSVEYCSSSGEVIGNSGVGGLVGSTSGGAVISRSFSTSKVTKSHPGTAWYMGGLIGSTTNSKIIDCYSTGDVEGSEKTGALIGLLGLNSSSHVTNCYATGNVNGHNESSLLFGYITDPSSGKIHNCYAWGESLRDTLTTSERNVSYTFGDVFGNVNQSKIEVDRVYIANDFKFETTRTNIAYISFDTDKLNRVAAKQRATYPNWDFNEIWQIVEGETYPTLRDEPLPVHVVYGELYYLPLNDIKLVSFNEAMVE